jgi:hypothetical protein
MLPRRMAALRWPQQKPQLVTTGRKEDAGKLKCWVAKKPSIPRSAVQHVPWAETCEQGKSFRRIIFAYSA